MPPRGTQAAETLAAVDKAFVEGQGLKKGKALSSE